MSTYIVTYIVTYTIMYIATILSHYDVTCIVSYTVTHVTYIVMYIVTYTAVCVVPGPAHLPTVWREEPYWTSSPALSLSGCTGRHLDPTRCRGCCPGRAGHSMRWTTDHTVSHDKMRYNYTLHFQKKQQQPQRQRQWKDSDNDNDNDKDSDNDSDNDNDNGDGDSDNNNIIMQILYYNTSRYRNLLENVEQEILLILSLQSSAITTYDMVCW